MSCHLRWTFARWVTGFCSDEIRGCWIPIPRISVDAAFLLTSCVCLMLRYLARDHPWIQLKRSTLKCYLSKKSTPELFRMLAKSIFKFPYAVMFVTFSLKGDLSRPCTKSHHVCSLALESITSRNFEFNRIVLSRSGDLIHFQVLNLLCSGKRMNANVKLWKLIWPWIEHT